MVPDGGRIRSGESFALSSSQDEENHEFLLPVAKQTCPSLPAAARSHEAGMHGDLHVIQTVLGKWGQNKISHFCLKHVDLFELHSYFQSILILS